MDVRIPARLAPGDLIGVVSPASPIDDPSRIEQGIRYLESLGYRTVVGANSARRLGYLAGTDEERASDLHAMFADRRVRAIFCVRGGYGSPRLLSLLDYRLIARNPKIFVGYSDITALHLAFWTKARLVTYHGPMLGVDMVGVMDPMAEESFWRTLNSPRRRMMVIPSGGVVLRGGAAIGRLLGGNLSLFVSLLGTPFQPDFRRALLFLEEIGEEPYRVDRMMTQLRNARILERAAGVAAGYFSDCVPKDSNKPSMSVEEIMREAAASARRPFVVGLPFGHERRSVTIPVGLRVRLDAGAGTLELLEPSVL
jgi:muramoyltetrapeptide carboxypeptidase